MLTISKSVVGLEEYIGDVTKYKGAYSRRKLTFVAIFEKENYI